MTVRVMASVADSYMGTVYFVGTDTGVFRANAIPWSWRAVNTGFTQRSIRAFTFFFEGSDENDGIGANDLLAGTNGGGVFLSGDGVSWWPKNSGLTNPFVTALAASSSYAVTFAGTEGGGVFRSTDAWGDWTAINDGLAKAESSGGPWPSCSERAAPTDESFTIAVAGDMRKSGNSPLPSSGEKASSWSWTVG